MPDLKQFLAMRLWGISGRWMSVEVQMSNVADNVKDWTKIDNYQYVKREDVSGEP